ncbi:MAG: DoxX family protein [Deltaproteobacteria bacterium]|nr:DoxX family protein [Deltaproteobacteria bacterium]
MEPLVIARFLVTAFFAVVFLQSALDKLTDAEGNLGFLREHFKSSPFPPEMVGPMFRVLTFLEMLAGVLCGLGVLFLSFRHDGMNLASWGLAVAGLALLALITGQRFAKDYGGAAVVAAYFAVDILGLMLFS